MRGGSEVADLVSLWHAAKRNFGGFKPQALGYIKINGCWCTSLPGFPAYCIHTMQQQQLGTRAWGRGQDGLISNTAQLTLVTPFSRIVQKTQRNDHLQRSSTVQRETLEEENFHKLVKNTIFVEKTFTDCSLLPLQRTPCFQIVRRKLQQIATKLRNSRQFSPSKVSRYTVRFNGFK